MDGAIWLQFSLSDHQWLIINQGSYWTFSQTFTKNGKFCRNRWRTYVGHMSAMEVYDIDNRRRPHVRHRSKNIHWQETFSKSRIPQLLPGRIQGDVQAGFWIRPWLLLLLESTGCSLNIVFFSRILKFATSPSPVLGCYWLYKKLPANRIDCKLAWRWELWRSLRAM